MHALCLLILNAPRPVAGPRARTPSLPLIQDGADRGRLYASTFKNLNLGEGHGRMHSLERARARRLANGVQLGWAG